MTLATTPSSHDEDDKRSDHHSSRAAFEAMTTDEQLGLTTRIEQRMNAAGGRRVHSRFPFHGNNADEEDDHSPPGVTELDQWHSSPFVQEHEFIYKANGGAHHLSRSAQRHLQFDDTNEQQGMVDAILCKRRPLEPFRNCVRFLLD